MRYLLLLLFCAGCGSTQPLSMHPVDAKIPELPFSYLSSSGTWVEAKGQKGEHFTPGQAKQLKIKLISRGGNCQVTYTDGDQNLTKDCKGLSEILLDLGTHYTGQPPVAGISVAYQNLGIQTGYWYPTLDPPHAMLPTSYVCPQMDSVGDISVCTRPATFAFDFVTHVIADYPGLLQYVWECDNSGINTTVSAFTGKGDIPNALNSDTPQYCVVRLDMKQNKQADGTYAIKQSHTIHIRFYDPKYIPLPIPIINQTRQAGSWQVCGAEDYAAMSINGVDRGGLGSGSCTNIMAGSVEAFAWDTIGRFSWASAVSTNAYKFYEDIRPYALKRVQRACPKLDEPCIRRKAWALIHEPVVQEAVQKWDASILYRGVN